VVPTSPPLHRQSASQATSISSSLKTICGRQ
jgi:hypothetical protein